MRSVVGRVVLVGAVAVAVTGRQNGADAASPQGATSSGPWSVGDYVPPLTGIDLEAKAITIDFAALKSPSILYSITPGGYFVRQNEAPFADLVRQVAGTHRIVVVSGRDDGLIKYVETIRKQWSGKPVTVVGGLTPEMKKTLRIGAYPSTVVIASTGRVRGYVSGAYTELRARQLDALLSIVVKRAEVSKSELAPPPLWAAQDR